MFVNHTSEGGFTRGRRRVTGERAVTLIIVASQVNADVSGLIGTGLVLHVAVIDTTASTSGSRNTSIVANGTTFDVGDSNDANANKFDDFTYTVSILTQPTGPAQVCTITAGATGAWSGPGNATTVTVVCGPAIASLFWQDFVGTQEL